MNAVLRFLAWLIAIALVVLPVTAVVNGWVAGDRWPLRTLRVTSQFERVDPQQLRATVMPYAKDGFFAVRLEDAQSAVAKLPWVERAEVRKRWPDILEIRIVEHTPFARWGDDKLLSEHGRLFPIKSVRGAPLPNGLPQLDGDPARVAEVVALYNESRALLSPGGINVRGLAQDERGSWSLTLGNGTEVVIGRSDAKARLSRFSRLLPRLLAQQQRRLARADLRYTNGFALVWTDATSERMPLPNQQGIGEGSRVLPRFDGTPSRPPAAAAGRAATTQAPT
ncbi:MAG: cell division protein FtsQ/DivIB [Luteimonas sp.]